MGGAWSKWYIALGAAEGHQFVFVGVLMLSSLLSIGYLMPVVVRAFFRAPSDADTVSGIREANPAMLVSLSVTALASVGLFFLAPWIRELLLPIVGG